MMVAVGWAIDRARITPSIALLLSVIALLLPRAVGAQPSSPSRFIREDRVLGLRVIEGRIEGVEGLPALSADGTRIVFLEARLDSRTAITRVRAVTVAVDTGEELEQTILFERARQARQTRAVLRRRFAGKVRALVHALGRDGWHPLLPLEIPAAAGASVLSGIALDAQWSYDASTRTFRFSSTPPEAPLTYVLPQIAARMELRDRCRPHDPLVNALYVHAEGRRLVLRIGFTGTAECGFPADRFHVLTR